MKRFNLKFFKRFWAIARLYWWGEEKRGAIALLALLGVLLVFYTQLSVSLNTQQGDIFSALASKNEDRFWQTVTNFLLILIIYVPLFAGFNFCQEKLGLYWRRGLTNRFLNQYFSDRSYYDLSHSNSNIDNPDQRISEDIRSFTGSSLNFFLLIIQSIFTIVAFSVVLWKISQLLVGFLIIYGLVGTLITTGVFGQTLIKINFDQLKKEADFRFGLVRIRENAESIAFYGGETRENNQLKQFFNRVFENYNRLIIWETLYLGMFQNIYEFVPYILPAVIVAPSVLSGEFEVGTVREAQGAFLRIFMSINIIISRFEQLTSFAAGVDRLYTFHEYLERTKTEEKRDKKHHPTIDTREAHGLAIEHLTLQTPNYQRILFEDLSVSLESGQGLLVMGASGCGKSSLLRAIAGLWKSGTGAIYRPKLNEILFLPQRPYMILGTLREQLLYPNVDVEFSDQKLQKVLEMVNLGNLAERFGGFDVQKDWSEVLSLGEQQRMAFARLLITRPQYAILDEATSALDINNEKNLYQHLRETKTTVISVGHRPSLSQYHQLILEFLEGNRWQLKRTDN
ncbi:ABC transporter domain protein [Gloeothece citriformis PCC 7424]|uniref:ABC transporter domain protein n=1 Tax=Gloeothece citriformis (strain PCC 7424) TaxID=65393 RepID=B7KJG7_GLOC7|nr:ABC transporter ATP-binding protein/permease [Gloeothece citriformis]ACK73644.1 ABC transporter domain protein [Gloeothece citriformis PCC 7424]